jgi:LPS sulfotransferase NodH
VKTARLRTRRAGARFQAAALNRAAGKNGAPMDFEYSAKSKEWIARVSAFMDRHVYPNVETFESQRRPLEHVHASAQGA